MNSDSEVMADLGGPMSRADSDAKFDRYASAWVRDDYGRWALETTNGEFVGYTGVNRRVGDHPLGDHDEIGWRLVRSAWGRGYAVEAATAALADVFARVGLNHVLSYTAPDNARSQRVMERLQLDRRPELDFASDYPGMTAWRGLVWSTVPARWGGGAVQGA